MKSTEIGQNQLGFTFIMPICIPKWESRGIINLNFVCIEKRYLRILRTPVCVYQIHLHTSHIFTAHDSLARDMEAIYQHPDIVSIVSAKKQF